MFFHLRVVLSGDLVPLIIPTKILYEYFVCLMSATSSINNNVPIWYKLPHIQSVLAHHQIRLQIALEVCTALIKRSAAIQTYLCVLLHEINTMTAQTYTGDVCSSSYILS
jgi:hypothetical protein